MNSGTVPSKSLGSRGRASAKIWCLGWTAAACLAGSAVADPVYDLFVVEAFEPTGLRECYMWDVNESGRSCGTSTFQSFYAGFTWTETSDKTQIPIVWTEDINNLDQIAGDAAVHDLTTGTTTFVPGLNSTYATPYVHGLNDGGMVVGHAKGPGSDSDEVNRTPIIWDAVNGVRGVAVAGARELLRVNNANVAVGNLRFSAGDSEAWVYDIGAAQSVFLHGLLSPSGLGTSSARDINESGVAVGKGWNGTATQGFIWSETMGFKFMPGLNGGETMRVHPYALNEANEVVGNALDGATGEWRAFLWDPGVGMRDLNDLIESPAGFILDRARGINDGGVIVGDGHYGPGFGLALGFVLVPRTSVSVPEPVRTADAALLRLARGTTNPSRDAMGFEFDVRAPGLVRVTVYDVAGREVRRLVDAIRDAGRHTTTWDGRSRVGDVVASGTYFVRLESESSRGTKKIVRRR